MTVLANPDKRPWDDLRELTDRVPGTSRPWGSYFICCRTKPGRDCGDVGSWRFEAGNVTNRGRAMEGRQ